MSDFGVNRPPQHFAVGAYIISVKAKRGCPVFRDSPFDVKTFQNSI